ncbi:DNA-3-methyladenine glycosylase [Fodinicola feengrottensis]|uniref:DNA-3-methyladenine glycosylase n=1 Tax=Fodinicola feengrottensis TaxID=435914 RepID=A0ABN2IK00_9ACTN
MTVDLSAKQPFDLRKSLRAMAYFRPAAGEQLVVDDTVRKAFAVRRGAADHAVVVEVAPSRTGVRVAVHGAQESELDGVHRTVADWLSLDDDPTPFLAIAEKDPPMADILRVTRGLHQVRFASLAEGVCYFLLTHRTSQAVAAGRKRRLAVAYGPRLALDGVEHVAFPTLENLAGRPASELRAYAANDQQAERLTAAIAGVTDLGEAWLREAPTDEVHAALLRIHGIGEFTASAIGLRVLGRPIGPPIQMRQFADTVATVYGDERTADDVRRGYGEQFGVWSYVTRTGLGWLDDKA